MENKPLSRAYNRDVSKRKALRKRQIIRNIYRWDNPDYYDYEVYQTVNEQIIKKGPFYELDIDLNDLGRILRTTYQQYAYIGIKKTGAKLIIEIATQEVPDVTKQNDNTPGDIIAKYDAYIEGIEAKKGAVVVMTSQSVKKGSLLISGNVNYKINPSDLTKLVRAEGLILGRVAEYKEYEIKKENYIYDYSSNVKKYYELNLFGRIIKTKNNILSNTFNYTGVGVVNSPIYGKILVELFIGK